MLKNELLERIYNLLWLCLDQGGRVLGSLLSTILVINYLGPEGFGTISISLACITLLVPVVSLGMDSILFKRFINGENNRELIETSCFMRLSMSIIVFISITFLNYLSNDIFINLLNILAIGFFFDSFLSLKDYFAAVLKNQFYTYSTLISLGIQLLILYTMTENNVNIELLSIAYVTTKFVQNLILHISYYKVSGQLVIPKLHLYLVKNLLLSSSPMMFAALIGTLYVIQDQFFIKLILGEESVGIYAVGIRFVVILVVFPTIISNVFYPSLVKKFNLKNKVLFEKQLESIYLLFYLIGVGCFVFVYFSAPLIIDFLFSSEFHDSILVMEIYSFILMVSFFQSINNKILILYNLQHIIFKRALMALIINAVLNFIFIPKYGVVGAAYSTVISEFIVIFSYAMRRDTYFIFVKQIRAVLLFGLFKSSFIKNLKS